VTSPGWQALLFAVAAAVSLAASWLLVSRLERLAGRAGLPDVWLGLVAALAADAPEITSAVVALARGQASVGTGVVTGSNVFNLAALLGLAAVTAGPVAFHRRVVLAAGGPGLWVAGACLATVAGLVSPAAGLVLAAAVLVPGTAVLGMSLARLRRIGLPDSWAAWLAEAGREEGAELEEAVRARPGAWPDAVTAAAALAAVVGASTVMELAATAVGARYAVPEIVTGGLVLAAVTSLPNAVSAVYLARRGRGAAVLSIALNSNAINVVAGLLIPAALTGLGPPSGQDVLVAAWYAGLTLLALALAFRGRGLSRLPGAVIIAGYLAFAAALAVSIAQHGVHPAAALIPAGVTAAAGTALLARRPGAGNGGRRDSLVPGWSTRRVTVLSVALCGVIAATDAASGPHLILIGLLICGPCCALLTARWAPTAAVGCLALALGIALGIPDQIFATQVQYAFLGAIVTVSAAATASAVILQRRRA
jgi:cation:H+ antiporter